MQPDHQSGPLPSIAWVVGAAALGLVGGAAGGDTTATSMSGPLVVAGMVLVVSGVAKVRSPQGTRSALDGLGLAVPASAVRALGAVEVALGVAASVWGGAVVAVAVGLLYAAFAVVAVLMIRSGDVADCGCFGSAESDAPPGPLHVGIDLVFAGLALAGAALGSGGAVTMVDASVIEGLVALVGCGVAAYGVVALLTVVARLDVLERSSTTPGREFHLLENR